MSWISKNNDNVKNRTRMFWYGATIVAIFLFGSIVVTGVTIQSHFAKQKQELQHEQGIELAGKKESFSLWLSSLVNQGDRLINSDLFRLFSAEVAKLGDRIDVLFALGALDGIVESKPAKQQGAMLVAQLPLMQSLLQEFIVYSDFLSGRVVNERTQIYLSSEKTPLPLTQEQKVFIQEVFSKNKVLFSPIKSTQHGLTIDVFFPIQPPHSAVGTTKKPVAVLVVSKIIANDILNFLNSSGNARVQSALYLLQKTVGLEYVSSNGGVEVVRNSPIENSLIPTIPFGERNSVHSDAKVFSTGIPVPETSWILLEETPVILMEKAILAGVQSLIIFAVLSTCIIVLCFIALWWYLMEREQRSLASDFKALYMVIDEQQQVLNGINSSIVDMIALTDVQNTMQYVNKGFSETMGKSAEALLGRTMEEVFGFDTAKRITMYDAGILSSGNPHSFEDVIFIKSKKYNFQIIRTPYTLSDGTSTGIVSVYRDITAMVEAEEHAKKILQQTVEALIQTIELRDPYLAGHTRMMKECVLGIGKTMECAQKIMETMEIATDLSQIGKLSIPKKILTKTTALTDEEKACMEEHVAYSLKIIANIDFELPVARAIEQMNERVDGSGYPSRLQEEAICFEAKVLAVANAFCALIKPRSYRSALSVEKALEALEQQHGYSKNIIEALKEFIKTDIGKEFVAQYAC